MHETRQFAQAAARTREYIVSPGYDWCFFLAPPLIALCVGIAVAVLGIDNHEIVLFGEELSWLGVAIGVFIHAHLVAVFFRSHGNANIRRLYPGRFILVPLFLYAGMMANYWFLIFISVLVTFWDVYHSGLQTFGFSRIYDRKMGNDATAGRRLDWWLNQLLYAGPIVAGVTMMDHFEDLEDFDEFSDPVSALFTSIPASMDGYHGNLAWVLLVAGGAFLAWYVFSYWRLYKQGHKVSILKIYLLVSTGCVSIFTWGFNSFGQAFFIMNLFHALQYFGIVWAFEKNNMQKIFGTAGKRYGAQLALGMFVLLTFSYGFWVEMLDAGIEWLWGVTLVVSIMHFWYDGFIWSVRSKQV